MKSVLTIVYITKALHPDTSQCEIVMLSSNATKLAHNASHTKPFEFHTCSNIMGVILYSQCILVDEQEFQLWHHSENVHHLDKKLWTMQRQVNSWHSCEELLGPNLQWAEHYKDLLKRKPVKNTQNAVTLKCHGDWCSSYFNLATIKPMELCGRTMCDQNANGTALVLDVLGICSHDLVILDSMFRSAVSLTVAAMLLPTGDAVVPSSAMGTLLKTAPVALQAHNDC